MSPSYLTQNFTQEEMRCRCGKCPGGTMNQEFMKKLQVVRDGYGSPMQVVSGFRCEAHNKVEGGSKSSMHLLGRAADIRCVAGSDKFRLMMIAVASGLNGIGVGKDFLHLDDREEQVLWTY